MAQTFEEADGYELGMLVKSLSGWKANAGAIAQITDQQSADGKQSLQIGAGENEAFVERTFQPAGDGVTFIDFWILPTVDLNEPAVSMDVDGAMIGFETVADGRAEVRCAVSDPREVDKDISTGSEFAISETGEASEWLRLTVREDRKAGTWDLFVNGELRAASLPRKTRAEKQSSLRFFCGAGTTYVDDIQIADSNVLFPDADKDGLPDAYEKAHGLNPFLDDREANADGDGASNIAEYLAGTSPDVFGESTQRILYVNNVTGAEANTGTKCEPTAGASGPLRSLHKALMIARPGDSVFVMAGKRLYDEDAPEFPARDGVTVTFEDPNTIVDLKK